MIMQTKIFTQEGKEQGTVTLPESVFGVKWNPDLVHEVVISMQANERGSTAHTKGRGDVRGGGKKPWKQKGTGRARHGSRRSPIWTGGGVSHGPQNEKDYSKKINRKVRSKALAITLSKKFADGEVIFVDTLTFASAKAADAKKVFAAIATGSGNATMATKRKNAALIVLSRRDNNAELSFRNFGHIEVVQAKDVNPVDLLSYKYVVVAEPEKALETLQTRVGEVKKAK